VRAARETKRDRERDTERDRETERQRERQRERDGQRRQEGHLIVTLEDLADGVLSLARQPALLVLLGA
jgi:hypothetical protein